MAESNKNTKMNIITIILLCCWTASLIGVLYEFTHDYPNMWSIFSTAIFLVLYIVSYIYNRIELDDDVEEEKVIMSSEDKKTIDNIIKMFWEVEKERGDSASFYNEYIDYYTMYFGKYYIHLQSFSKTLYMDDEKVKVYKIKLDDETFNKVVDEIFNKFNGIKKDKKEKLKSKKKEELYKTFTRFN